MGRYVAGRLVQLVPVMWLIGTIVFVVFRIIPGDPAMLILGPEASAQSLAALRVKLGIDQPIPVQYVTWIVGALHGDIGRSFISQDPVGSLVLSKLPVTAELALLGLLIGTLIGVPCGIVSAVKQDTWIDNLVRTVSLFGFCMPHYWLAIVLIAAFAVRFPVLPVAGFVDFGSDPIQNLRFVLLPALTVGLPIAAIEMRFLRSGLLDVIRVDYIRTARSKGLSERAVLVRHAIRNALIPFLSVLGLQAGWLLGGSVIVEQIFRWPGIGWLMIQSITGRDYPVVQGAALLAAFVFVVVNLLVDIACALSDPRIRLGA